MTSLACLSLMLNAILLNPALAGTENGEFCPTCPDWTDLDGWLAKKAAYDQTQQNSQPQNLQTELVAQSTDLAAAESSLTPLVNNSTEARSGSFKEALISPSDISAEDVILDISPSATRYIEGSVSLNYENFMEEDWTLKTVSEIALLLGDAGISANDSLVIAGECLPCGGGPTPSVFTYWLLRYLGHENVRILEGRIEDWEAAGLNTSEMPALRPRTEYSPRLKPELLATYDYVANGGAQIVDARPAVEFRMNSIPGAVNIPYEDVLDGDNIKSEEDLNRVFIGLKKDRPIVVYTNVGLEASLVWFTLTLCGYDARLYSWRDWLDNRPKFGFELAEAKANPNPVRYGATTTITASFKDVKNEAGGNSSQNGEMKLEVMGCATCGFGGFSLGASGAIGNGSGAIQLGYSSKPSQAGGVRALGGDTSLRCTALISGPDGAEVSRTNLLRSSGYEYVGLWNANVTPGIYSVSIAASASGNSETFADVFTIEVIR